MEALLLAFYNLHLREFSQKEVSHTLGVSQKHLSRCLARWAHEGILSYKSGIGRGNPSVVTWHIDVDTQYFLKVERAFQSDDIAQCIPYLTWDFSHDKKLQLLLKANQLLGVDTAKNDKLVIRKRYAPLTLDPLNVTDINSFNILKNIYDSLVIHKNGQFHPKLAQHIDVMDRCAEVILRKQIYFHDGSLLTARDAMQSLEAARQADYTKELLSPITHLEYVHDHSFKIHYTSFPHVLDVLSTLNMSIYKVSGDHIIGTGPFYIEKNSTIQTTLKSFAQYYGLAPYIDEIELLYIPAIKIDEFQISEEQQHTAHLVTDGFYYALKLKQNQLTLPQQETIHYLLQQFKNHTDRFNISKQDVQLLSRSKYYKKTPSPLTAHFSLAIVYPSYINKLMLEIKSFLASYHITLQLIPIALEEALSSTIDYDADYYIHGAFLNGSERYEYFSFLFQNPSVMFHVNHHIKSFNQLKDQYLCYPINKWNRLNRLVDRYLDRHFMLFPLFHNQKTLNIPSSVIDADVGLHGFYNWDEVFIKK